MSLKDLNPDNYFHCNIDQLLSYIYNHNFYSNKERVEYIEKGKRYFGIIADSIENYIEVDYFKSFPFINDNKGSPFTKAKMLFENYRAHVTANHPIDYFIEELNFLKNTIYLELDSIEKQQHDSTLNAINHRLFIENFINELRNIHKKYVFAANELEIFLKGVIEKTETINTDEDQSSNTINANNLHHYKDEIFFNERNRTVSKNGKILNNDKLSKAQYFILKEIYDSRPDGIDGNIVLNRMKNKLNMKTDNKHISNYFKGTKNENFYREIIYSNNDGIFKIKQ